MSFLSGQFSIDQCMGCIHFPAKLEKNLPEKWAFLKKNTPLEIPIRGKNVNLLVVSSIPARTELFTHSIPLPIEAHNSGKFWYICGILQYIRKMV
jgi:hypothetical protein